MQTRFGFYAIVLLTAARAACGYLQGVCQQEECKELSRGCQHDTYRLFPNNPVYLGEPPECHIWVHPCHNHHCGNCENTSPELWPHLTFTLEHYNKDYFGVAISWEQPAGVTGYVLLLTHEPYRRRCGGEGMANLNECMCANITNPNTTTHTFKHFYLSNQGQPKTLHLKLIPTPWCNGPSITIPTPKTCHNILPGNCNICGIQDPLYISPPTNVHLTPLPSQRGVFISWELGESYYWLPYPNISFFLQIRHVVNSSEATPRLQVVGKTNVTLQNFNTNNNYSVQIRAVDCGCGYWLSSPVYFYLTEPELTTEPEFTPEPELTPEPTLKSQPEPHDSAVNVIILSTVLLVASGLVIVIVVIAAILVCHVLGAANPKEYVNGESGKSSFINTKMTSI